MSTLILAHQGGWDEMLLVIAPVALIGVLLLVANRRARTELARRDAATPDGEAAAPTGGDGSGNGEG